jgi:hypothetical protein
MMQAVRGMTIARVGGLATPMLDGDAQRLTELLRQATDQPELANRIAGELAGGSGAIDLDPRSAAEKTALEVVLTDLIFEGGRARSLLRLRDAVTAFEPPEVAEAGTNEPENGNKRNSRKAKARASLEQALQEDVRSATDAQHAWRAELQRARGEIDAGTTA